MSTTSARIPYRLCPLCGDNEFVPSIKADCTHYPLYHPSIPAEMQWVDCKSCGHQFVDGYFTDEALKVLFDKVHKGQNVGDDIEKQRWISARIIEKVLPFVTEGQWVDVGFGNGSLLFTAAEFGFNVIGVDLRLGPVERIKKLGVEAYCERFENLRFAMKPDVVSLMDVLEHIPFPNEMLKHVHERLSDDGCLLLSMPNSESVLWDIATKTNSNPYYAELEHYHNFSRSRLVALLKDHGFQVVSFGLSSRYRMCMELVAKKRSI